MIGYLKLGMSKSGAPCDRLRPGATRPTERPAPDSYGSYFQQLRRKAEAHKVKGKSAQLMQIYLELTNSSANILQFWRLRQKVMVWASLFKQPTITGKLPHTKTYQKCQNQGKTSEMAPLQTQVKNRCHLGPVHNKRANRALLMLVDA